MLDTDTVIRPARVRPVVFALGLVGLGGSSSCSSSEPAAKEPEALHEQAVSQSSSAFASSATVMRTLQDALGALDRGDYVAWDRVLETGLVPALDKAIADLEALRATEKDLSNAALPPLGTSAPLTLRPQFEPLTILGGALAVGALIGTYRKVRGYFSGADQAAADCVAKRMAELSDVYGPGDDVLRRNHAEKLCAESKFKNGLEAVTNAGATIVSEAGEEIVETAVGRLPLGKLAKTLRANDGSVKAIRDGALSVGDAAETGTLIGSTPECRTQDGSAPRSVTVVGAGLRPLSSPVQGTCAVYIGRSTTHSFANVPEGDWDLTLYSPGFERSVAASAAVRMGQITRVSFRGKRLRAAPAAAQDPQACVDAKLHICGKLAAMGCSTAAMDSAVAKLEGACGATVASAYRQEAERDCRANKLKCEFGPKPTCTTGPETRFDYAGLAEADGRSASLKLTFVGDGVTGELVGNPTCSGSVRLTRTQLRFTGALRGKWEDGGTVAATWTGGDYGCDGALMVDYPTSGNLTVRKAGAQIELRRVAGGGRYLFAPSGRSYVPACP